jgi:hypothetical protein
MTLYRSIFKKSRHLGLESNSSLVHGRRAGGGEAINSAGDARTHKGERESTRVRKITEYVRTKRGKWSEEAPG